VGVSSGLIGLSFWLTRWGCGGALATSELGAYFRNLSLTLIGSTAYTRACQVPVSAVIDMVCSCCVSIFLVAYPSQFQEFSEIDREGTLVRGQGSGSLGRKPQESYGRGTVVFCSLPLTTYIHDKNTKDYILPPPAASGFRLPMSYEPKPTSSSTVTSRLNISTCHYVAKHNFCNLSFCDNSNSNSRTYFRK
jgi:hypothetical protein